MKIAVLGTGGVGKAFAPKLKELGHQVVIGTRDVKQTLADDKKGFTEFLKKNEGLELRSFAEAAAWADVLINVSKGSATLDVIRACGISNLKDKIIVDISNPLDFSKGMPPTLIPELCNTTSLGEEIQKLVPGAKVVKTLNTMWNGLMINPSLINGGNHVNYICGNDEGAKQKVKELLYQLGWKKENVLDIGDITGARATEATLPIWLRVYGARQSGSFNFQIVS
jgi:8-hydroxy-5-deazaflavin:NADPH oxidoreductase